MPVVRAVLPIFDHLRGASKNVGRNAALFDDQ